MTAGAPRILLTVSGDIPADVHERIAAGDRPRADYFEMARAMGADLVDHAAARRDTGRLGRLIDRLAGANALLAWECFRRRRDYAVIVTDGEQVGIPLAALMRVGGRGAVRHAMIVHVLSTPKKTSLIRALRLASLVDLFLVYASAQRDHVAQRLRVPAERIRLTPFMVDTKFFSPAAVEPRARARPMVCSAGLERRDYSTLVEAVAGLPVDVVIAAASPWSKQRDNSGDRPLPDNVTIERLGFVDLRQLYADATAVVMPLLDVDFQAGITTILEAMSMGKPTVCTRTAGQTDTIVDDVTGLYVGVGDVAGVRAAIERVIADDELRSRLGSAARRQAVEQFDVAVYAARLADEITRLARSSPRPRR